MRMPAVLVVLALSGCGPRFEMPAAAPTAAPMTAPSTSEPVSSSQPATTAPAQTASQHTRTTRRATAAVGRSTAGTATRTSASYATGSVKGLPPSRLCQYTKEGTAPMTGRAFDEVARPGRPLLAIKIENSPYSHPHTGLEAADVVVEHVVEGGITRFTGMYHSCVPDVVGPVRSVRPVDPEFLPAYDPLLAYSGGRAEVVKAMQRAGMVTLRDGYAPGFFRLASRKAPHNLYVKPAALYRAGKDKVPTAGPAGWTFSDEPTRGSPMARATVRMSARDVATWTYKPKLKVYRRLQNGRPHRVTGDGHIGPSNVVIMRVKITDGGCCDTSGARYAAIGVIGSGPVQVLRDGMLINGTWQKKTRHHRLRLFDRDGEPLPLAPGRTWVMLAPRTR
jgi:hypothetical protein